MIDLHAISAMLNTNGNHVYRIAAYSDGKQEVCPVQEGNALCNIYSITKNFTAVAFAYLCQLGEADFSESVGHYLPEGISYPAYWNEVTVASLLSQNVGHSRGFLFNAERSSGSCPADFLSYALNEPQTGNRFCYSNATFYIASRLIERIYGDTLEVFWKKELFPRLGIRAYRTVPTPLGHTFGASDLYLDADGLLALGRLLLNEGETDAGERIFARGTFTACPRVVAPFDEAYGLSFWWKAKDAPYYYCSGAHGQLLIIMPNEKSLLAVQSKEAELSVSALYGLCRKQQA